MHRSDKGGALMQIIDQSAALIIDPREIPATWCVYEHLMQMDDDGPPVVIYVNACKLLELYRLGQGKQNTEWVNITKHGRPIIIKVVATGTDRMVIQRHAMKHLRSMSPMPMCNLRGFSLAGRARTVYCSNGKTYNSQDQAAQELGISQSAISKHLRGDLQQVRGLIFSYMPVLDEQVT